MKVTVQVVKRVYGTMEIEIPEEVMNTQNRTAIKIRINKYAQKAIHGNTPIIWQENEVLETDISYTGNYKKEGYDWGGFPEQEQEERE